MSSPFRFLLLAFCLQPFLSAPAEVVRVELLGRRDLASTGYEEILGRLHFEVDPALPVNRVIADIDLAPVTAAGRVAFSSDLRVLRPKKSPAGGGAAAWIEIPNRGGKSSLSDWIMRHGFTLVNVGWEFDLAADKLRLQAPAARNPDGSPVRGVVSAVLTPDRPASHQELADLLAYPPADLDGPDSRLIIRDHVAFPGGAELPRDQWTLHNQRLSLRGGFQPGRTYEVFYLAEAPPVAGLGYAAVRDAVAWFKHAPESLAPVSHVHAFGSSQCGRFLRDFVYLGFNTDERDRRVLDGMVAHVAGAGRLVLNQRWSTPRSVAGYATASYPFTDTAQPDALSGQTEGILDNPRVRHAPKIFYTNMAAEYWGAGRVAALTHTTPDGKSDIPLPDNVRSYFFACTSHGPAPFPPAALVHGAPLANPVNANPAVLALRLAMHRWVSEGLAPPPSVHPKISDGTLVPVNNVNFPKVPGLASPIAVKAGGRVRNPRLPGGAAEGAPLPLLVPQCDADGNDLGGIRMPEVAVPLATATGWVFRPAQLGSPGDFYLLRGAWVPFPWNPAERSASHDPRLSIEERYPSKQAYLDQIRAATRDLVNRRLLAESDLEPQLKLAGERWDWLMSRAMPSRARP